MNDDSLRAIVEQFIEKLRQGNAVAISAPYVADSVLAGMPHSGIFTDAEKTAAYIGIGQVARSILQSRHSAEYDAQRVGQQSLDLPEASLLNGSYSVLREGEPIHVPRLQMTRSDMEYVCAKFDALSGYFARASRAVRADFERRNASAA